MSLHKLTAGSGYDYLTRQVAALDATDKGHVGLASYYTEKGETPGVWLGRGVAGIDGLRTGDIVTADHMQNLFGAGHHPLATQRTQELDRRIGRPGTSTPTEADYQAATRLGAPFKVYENDISAFRVEVARRLAAVNRDAGVPADWAVPAATRASIRTQVARELFRSEHGREPAAGSEGARELATTIAQHSRPKTTAVAGYDLTFSPVKSVSTLWALADPRTAALIEQAHRSAIDDALTFLETRALYTRQGANGVRQVDVRGLVATAFTHRDSRAGDPDLHTHVAVSNKVQTLDGRWLAIDGRPLHKAVVSASETYNTALERHLADTLGVQFAERPHEDSRKRPVREIVGVDPTLNTRFSKRRLTVEERRGALAAAFHGTHGRPPTPVEMIRLAQQATLETREAKHEPRSLAEQRHTWHREAVEVLGTPRRVSQMVHLALHPAASTSPAADSAWFATTIDQILETMEGARSTWQYWHVYAEAQRRVRAAHVPTREVPQVVDLLVGEVLDGLSVSLAQPADEDVGISEPCELRRTDGSSVYTTAGADMYTSNTVLGAEGRLVAAAGLGDGHAVEVSSVDLALLESTANGITLNAGQAALVREMATSGARLQLALAPAGSGKTAAMRALATAWTDSGGTIIGLAPSAAAADALRRSIAVHDGVSADTLAKLTHSLRQPRQPRVGADVAVPDWVTGIDAATLVIVDEAGMADTVSLDAVVTYVLDRGGSVRLIGDDQQLAAIGAGGVLRDIRATHGALQLTELVRFQDPAEAATSLALREGHSSALGFYLDHDRIHVGDLATMTEGVFAAWQSDRAAGLDAIMLAPTRDLVRQLNQQARTHRLNTIDGTTTSPNTPGSSTTRKGTTGPETRLADGNTASLGELIITRANDRRIRTSSTDWVKNGDRWTVVKIHPSGDLTVQHLRHRRIVRLPSAYVQASTELGYACTVHAAQGVTADTMHGLATGQESRQQLYTMMTRGSVTNHVYLEVVGDGDPHSVIHPNLVRPLTPTDILESMLARDDAQRSATSLLREQADPAHRLGRAAQRYLDSLYVAAEDVLRRSHDDRHSPNPVDRLDHSAETLVPGLSEEAAWPTLRGHLLLLAVTGQDPVAALQEAGAGRELATATDSAAVLDWRLDPSGLRNAGSGPLAWMPAIPDTLRQDSRWGVYLSERAQLVEHLADQVRATATAHAALPAWAQHRIRPDDTVIADVEVWRAAMQVPHDDRRPTGAAQLQKAAATHQRRLDRALGHDTPAFHEWGQLLYALAPSVRRDDFTPLLVERLAALSRAGVQAHLLLRSAVTTGGTLPDEHAAAALWWRIARHTTPAVTNAVIGSPVGAALNTEWETQLSDLLGKKRADRLRTSTWWPALVSNVDHALQRGWRLDGLLGTGHPTSRAGWETFDECQALVWHTSIALHPIPDEHGHDDPALEPPADMWESVEPDLTAAVASAPGPNWILVDDAGTEDLGAPLDCDDAWERSGTAPPTADEDSSTSVDADLARAGYIRDLRGVASLEPAERDIQVMYERAEAWHSAPVTRERMLEINDMTQSFFEDHFTSSWGRDYLAARLGIDLVGHEQFRPGQAPVGWTDLVHHLHRRGVADIEMLATGVASRARSGRLIDRFRDRVMFPVVRDGQVLGFVGRRHPAVDDAGKQIVPKYLNTADTPLFHKGAQLFGVDDEQLSAQAVPVIVEGPVDAIAVTMASAGRYRGVAPLGTALTHEQATQLAAIGIDPIVATDADLAGQVSAQRDFWMLTPHGLDPGYARLPLGLDPADLLALQGPAALTAALVSATSLGDRLLSERLDNLSSEAAVSAAIRVIAARPAFAWNPNAGVVQDRIGVDEPALRSALRDAVREWDFDPRSVARHELDSIGDVRRRLHAEAMRTPEERWAPLAFEIDPRLLRQSDWPAAATVLQEAHLQGHDVRTAARQVVAEIDLGRWPARELRYRVAMLTGVDVGIASDSVSTPSLRNPATGHLETPTTRPEIRRSQQR